MLNVYFGDMPGAIYNTAVYFKNTYRDEWITDDFGRSVIRDIDSSEVLSAQVIESPVLGSITPLMLSGGVKTLLLVKHMRSQVFNASTCGDNCARWLLNIAQDRKVTVNLYHVMDFGEEEFKIRVLNSGKTVHTMTELIQESAEYL
ncbi:DUF4869 domain-containing protein [[Collinsella] massiliensis]|uniref:DUF4869 domain-containing protein n=1 Tax=[Collinsella] massiliensis TaxID=1232426 RepID=A0A1Y3XXI8_9ACTN|nr:DUF4869 domain-containing protein [[Collinsella] massiliensis]OUN89038.1 DUF4869 domain-containing protein [[Collinsella] massiliensis]